MRYKDDFFTSVICSEYPVKGAWGDKITKPRIQGRICLQDLYIDSTELQLKCESHLKGIKKDFREKMELVILMNPLIR